MVKVERRQSRRTDVDVIISLKKLDESRISACSGETVDVNVINLSQLHLKMEQFQLRVDGQRYSYIRDINLKL